MSLKRGKVSSSAINAELDLKQDKVSSSAAINAINAELDLKQDKVSSSAELALKQDKTGNTFTVETIPDAAANVGRVVYVSNGSAGSPCAAISNGVNWNVIALGANIAAE